MESDRLSIAPAVPSDAPGVTAVLGIAFGRTYIAGHLPPARYERMVAEGELLAIVAKHGAHIVGHVALELEAGETVVERGMSAVVPEFRGHHVLQRMDEALYPLAKTHGLTGFYGMPVATHTASQRNDAHFGMSACGVALGIASEDIVLSGFETAPASGQRVSCVMTYIFVEPPVARYAYMPARYRDVAARIYGALKVRADLPDPDASLPAAPATRMTSTADPSRQSGAIRFAAIGVDALARIDAGLGALVAGGAVQITCKLPLDDPATPAFAEALRERGFFFQAIVPGGLAGVDALWMQRLDTPLDTSLLAIETALARELLAFVDRDRAAVSGSARPV